MTATQFFVTGIDTDIGKTIISAILVEALKADYWKPVQAGNTEDSDSKTVQGLISNNKSHFFEETYKFRTPASPHYAAELDGMEIDFEAFSLPDSPNNLIVEGAGGLFVPLNKDYLIIDLIQKLNLPVIMVIKHYLGSINHSLSSIYALQQRNIEVHGLIFNGGEHKPSESYILEYSKIRSLGNIPKIENISKKDIVLHAEMLRNLLF
jgi:dethiobiotin synthetase